MSALEFNKSNDRINGNKCEKQSKWLSYKLPLSKFSLLKKEMF